MSYSIKKNISQKNLNNFFNQSLKSLITDTLIRSEGLKFNKNILNLVKDRESNHLLKNGIETLNEEKTALHSKIKYF